MKTRRKLRTLNPLFLRSDRSRPSRRLSARRNTVTRFQLVFRRDGHKDEPEYRFNNQAGEPNIDGKLIVDGETYLIRDVEWLLRRDDAGDSMPRFLCTPVVEPAFIAHSASDKSAATAPPK
jgi:hypothetical protein